MTCPYSQEVAEVQGDGKQENGKQLRTKLQHPAPSIPQKFDTLTFLKGECCALGKIKGSPLLWIFKI